MTSNNDDQMFSADADASDTMPVQASALRVGGYVCLRGNPCIIKQITSAKTGKHGGCKIHIAAVDIFTGQRHEEHFMSGNNVPVPNVVKKEYQLIDIDDEDFMTLLLDNGDTKEDLKVPDNELGVTIRKEFESDKTLYVTTISAMGKELPTSFTAK